MRRLIIHIALLGGLMIAFGGKMLATSTDFIAHYSLIHWLSTKGQVLATDPDSAVMATYPPVSHWLAAILGWFAGSDLVGLMLAIIAALYLAYLLVALLVLKDRGIAGMVVFAAIFLLLAKSGVQVGWEIALSFFYPQLVGDVAYLALLYWLASQKREDPWLVAIVVPLAAGLTMWLQPIASVHMLGAAAVLTTFYNVRSWHDGRLARSDMLALGFLVVAGSLVVGLHPKFAVMRAISLNDGAVAFHFTPALVAFIAASGAAACLNLWFAFREHDRASVVTGAAALAAGAIMLAQYAALELAGAGSMYAVRKHTFLLVTLGAINMARLLSRPRLFNIRTPALAGPLMAAAATAFILYGIGIQSAPVFQAITFANRIIEAKIAAFKPANAVYADPADSIVTKLLVSVAGFNYPLGRGLAWFAGSPPDKDAAYVMIRKRPSENCRDDFVNDQTFSICSTH